MADVTVNLGSVDAVSSPKTPKTPKKTAVKKEAKKPTHPGTKNMVVAAVKNLNERQGSSLSAIKKYIAANYKVDSERLAPFLRKAVKSALASGILEQSKGSGASGSVRMPGTGKPEKKAVKGKKVVGAKRGRPAGKKLAKKGSPTKAAVSKIVVAEKSKTAKVKVVKAKLTPKSPVKKNAKRSPTKKPMTPKPKKTVGRPKKSLKK